MDSTLASVHLLLLVQECPPLVRYIVQEMHHAVSVSTVTGVEGSSPLERYYSCVLSRLCEDAVSRSAPAGLGLRSDRVVREVRKHLSAVRFAPQLCLELTENYLHDTEKFLSDHIPIPNAPEASALEFCLNSNWILSVLSVDQSEMLVKRLLSRLTEELLRRNESLLSSFPVVEENLGGDSKEMCHIVTDEWLPLLELAFQCLRTSCAIVCAYTFSKSSKEMFIRSPSMHLGDLTAVVDAVEVLSSTVAELLRKASASDSTIFFDRIARTCLRSVFLLRALVCAAHIVVISCFASTTNAGPERQNKSALIEMDDAPTLVLLIDNLAALVKSPFDTASYYKSNETETANAAFLYFPYYLKLAVTLDCMVLLQDTVANMLGLFPNSVLPSVTFSTLSSALQRCIPQSRSGSSLLHKRGLHLLVTDFFALPVPTVISAREEFPGDWLGILHALLKSPCSMLLMTHRSPATATTNELSSTTIRSLMLHVLRHACPPVHSHLQRVIDLWLLCSVDPRLIKSHPIPSSYKHKVVVPILPNEIAELTEPLESISFHELTNLCASSSKPEKEAVTLSVLHAATCKRGLFLDSCENQKTRFGVEDAGIISSFVSFQNLIDMATDEFQLLVIYGNQRSCSSCHTALRSAASFRAIIACYTSLKYVDLCSRARSTQFTSAFATDARSLPLRPALSLVLYAHISCAHITSILPHSFEATTSVSSMMSHLRGDSSFVSGCITATSALLVSFLELTHQAASEVVLKERIYPLVVAAVALSVPPNDLVRDASSEEQNKNEASTERKSLPERIRGYIFCCNPPQVQAAFLALSAVPLDRIVSVVVDLLRDVINAGQSLFVAHAATLEVHNDSSSIAESQVNINNIAACSVAVQTLWEGVHALLPCPSRLELATVNLLLELGQVHRPRFILSWEVLVQEPLVLFRIPLELLRQPQVFSLVCFLYRSFSVAGENAANASSRVASRQRGLQGRDSEDRRQVTEFLNLQAVIVVRMLLELWVEVNYLATSQVRKGGERKELFGDTLKLDNYVRDAVNVVGSGICSMVTTLVNENSNVVGALLYYGVTQWTAFRLLASAGENVIDSIAEHTYTALTLSLKSEFSSPLSAIPIALECWLWHVIFLLKVQRMQPQCFSTYNNVGNRWICTLAESLKIFFNKTTYYSWWLVLPLVGNNNVYAMDQSHSLGTICLDLLLVLGMKYPSETLKITHYLTTTSLPPTHIFVGLQDELVTIRDDVCRNYSSDVRASGKRMRSEL